MSSTPSPSEQQRRAEHTDCPHPCRCVGLLGRLFGHKFNVTVGEMVYGVSACSRCGMPWSGWIR